MPSQTTKLAGQDDESNSPTDSDQYEDEEEEAVENGDERDQLDDKELIVWTGYAKRIPVMLFKPHGMISGFSDHSGKSIGEKYHMTYKLVRTESRLIRGILSSHGFHEVHPNSNNYNLMWTGSHLKPYILRGLQEFQKVNHFPRSYEITRKDRLYKNISRMQQIKGFRQFDFIPQSFMIPSEFQDFCLAFMKDKGPWIVKPIASSRGRGIFLVNHPEQLPVDDQVIVSKYINNPLLIDGFKFDLRLYVVVTSYDPLIIYIYEEGLTRFATVKFDKCPRSLRNQCMHLTNYSVNKKSGDYVRNDDPEVEDYGNKWSLSALLRYLRAMGRDTTALMMRVEDVIIKTMLSAELSIATACKMFMPHRANCFELYGFDILVDETLKPWILEVNLSPSLACDSPLDLKVKSNMIADLFSLVGFVCHDPMLRKMPQSRRNQDFLSRPPRAQSAAPVRAHSSRSAKRPQSANSRTSTGSKGSSVSVNPCGLSGEEIRVMRRSKEEFSRRGGWVRIFPSPDSWEFYGAYLQFNTNLNVVLYQQLYPERAAHLIMKPGGGFSTPIKTRILHTNSTLQVSSQPDSALSCALQRSLQYERKLSSTRRGHRRTEKMELPRPAMTSSLSPLLIDELPERVRHKEPLQQGVITASCPSLDAECGSTVDSEVTTSDSSVKQEAEKRTAPQLEPLPRKDVQPVAVTKYNVVQLLQNGKTMSKVQARFAFATYLTRVQHRLEAQTGLQDADDDNASDEQMDLVLRFLKRAAGNLHQTFRVIVPSRKLSISDRRRILSNQLGDFVHIYNRETDLLQHKSDAERKQLSRPPNFTQNEGLSENLFNQFVVHASEAELEEVLTTYTKLNKSASIFLGSSIKTSSSCIKTSSSCIKTSSSCPSQQQLPARTPTAVATTIGGSTAQPSADGRKEGGMVGGVRRMSHDSGAGGKTTKVVGHESGRGEVSCYGPHPSRLASASSFHSAMVAYSSKLALHRQRPFSANSSRTSGSYNSRSRPQSATTSASRHTVSSTHGDPGGGVTYTDIEDGAENVTDNNEQINEALRRLAVRQKQRQYTASKGSSVLHQDAADSASQPKTNQTWSAFPFPDDPLPSRPIQTNVVLKHTKHHGYTYPDGGSLYPLNHVVEPDEPTTSCQVVGSGIDRRTAPITACDTFHEFVNEPSNAPCQPGSLQYQQIKQKRMLEQSKALLEQSKAKHQEMVAQAHAAYRSRHPSNSYSNGADEPGFMQIYAPKPPPKPSSVKKPTSSHRVARRTIKDATTTHGFSLPHNALRPHVRSTSSLDAKRSMFDIHVAKSTIDYGQFYDGVPGGEENVHMHKHMYSSDYDIGY